MKKDLIIIGSYPNTKLSEDVLKKCIYNLSDTFDIVLSTHYTVDTTIQKLVNYYVFDTSNELIEGNDNPIIWTSNDQFYLQVKHLKNYAYSAYSCMLNGLTLLQNYYDYFYYVNGDTLIHPDDIDKLLNLKTVMLNNNKKAVFFKEFSGMVDSKIFLSDVKFFLQNIGTVRSKNEFVKYTQRFTSPYIPYVLESFFSERIDKWCNNKVHIVDANLEKYFKNSEIDVLSSFNGRSEKRRDYLIHLVKEKTSNKIFFVYVNNNVNFEEKQIDVKINADQFTLNNGNYSLYREVFVDGEHILLEVEGVVNTYNVKDIIENQDSYIQFN